MFRVIRTPSGEIVLDTMGRQNGRGAYVCRNSACLEQAVKNRGLERSLKIKIPDTVYEQLKEEMKAVEDR